MSILEVVGGETRQRYHTNIGMSVQEEEGNEKVGNKSRKNKNDETDKRNDKDSDIEEKKESEDKKDFQKCSEDADGLVVKNIKRKKGKIKKENDKVISDAGLQGIVNDEFVDGGATFEEKDFIDGEEDDRLTINREQDDEAKKSEEGKRKKANKTHDGEESEVDVVDKVERKKRKRRKKKDKYVLGAGLEEMINRELLHGSPSFEDEDLMIGEMGKKEKKEMVERKKRKRKGKKYDDDWGDGLQEIVNDKLSNENVTSECRDFIDSEGNDHLAMNKTHGRDAKNGNTAKIGNSTGIPKSCVKTSSTAKMKKAKSIENASELPETKGKPKKVSFSGQIEIFPLSNDPSAMKDRPGVDNLVRGKRFSQEEDEIIKKAVFNYIEVQGLGEEGLKMVLECRFHPKIKNCWKKIGTAIPYRPYEAIYRRAHILFEWDGKPTWTKEENELILKFQKEHGNHWRILADIVGKNHVHIWNAWRRLKLPNLKKGRWSQEEYQTLFDLVNMDLQMKIHEEKKSQYGMLRDNISWGAISDRLSTRVSFDCCRKWYKHLTSPLVAERKWADVDDYRLLDALFRLDACCIEDVDWNHLVDHRSGDVCRKRWDQMVRHIGQYRNKSFSEQVEILAKRYCPHLIEARETWDSKPVVP